jgi:hypothetical protein
MVARTCLAASVFAVVAPACCVAAGSRVRTPAGLRAAGELVVGERVLAVDVAGGRLVEREVVRVRRAVRECLALRCRGGALVCTPDHPIYAPDLDAWRPASDWVTGGARRLLVCVGEGVEVVEVDAVEAFAGVHEVVDLSLDDEPRSFIADGVVVHNKSLVPVQGLSAAAAGPAFTLEAPGDTRRYRVRICLDGDDYSQGELYLSAETSTRTKLVAGEQLWISLDSTANPQGPLAHTVPAMFFGFDERVPEDACSAGFPVEFEHVQGPQGAEIAVTWEVAASTDHDLDTPGESLEVSIVPED